MLNADRPPILADLFEGKVTLPQIQEVGRFGDSFSFVPISLVRAGMNEKTRIGLVGLAGVTAVLLFVGLSIAGSGAGFPLDDGWIHQTYARSLAETGRWEYVPGQVSAGSTAPLWTLLLAVGYVLQLPFFPWAFLLGAASLLWVAVVGAALWRRLWPEQKQGGLGRGVWPWF